MPFKPGKSGNPAGRPPGRTNHRGLVSHAFEVYKKKNGVNGVDAVITNLIKQALDGDTSASKLLLERVEPSYKPISRTININGRLKGPCMKRLKRCWI